MNQRRNEKLHPDGQYTDHLSMGRGFKNDIPNLLLISLLFIFTFEQFQIRLLPQNRDSLWSKQHKKKKNEEIMFN
jgi:hypothetical protein